VTPTDAVREHSTVVTAKIVAREGGIQIVLSDIGLPSITWRLIGAAPLQVRIAGSRRAAFGIVGAQPVEQRKRLSRHHVAPPVADDRDPGILRLQGR
jgi:hypothetical protein